MAQLIPEDKERKVFPQKIRDDIVYFEHLKDVRVFYSMMSLWAFYEFGCEMSEEEKVEWEELLAKMYDQVRAFLNKNVVDRNMRLQELKK